MRYKDAGTLLPTFVNIANVSRNRSGSAVKIAEFGSCVSSSKTEFELCGARLVNWKKESESMKLSNAADGRHDGYLAGFRGTLK